jgi:hypothetical protein
VTVLLYHTAQTQPQNLWVVVAMVGLAVVIEVLYRRFTQRPIDL